MNPYLSKLQPYPFEKLAQLKQGITPPGDKTPIVLSIGEPQHAPPAFISAALVEHLSGLGNYPTTKGLPTLRSAIGRWLVKRFQLTADALESETQILPVNGTREALFSFVQCVVAANKTTPLVLMPNPFYQIYEGATLLAGAEPYFLNTTAAQNYLPDFTAVPESVWARCQLLFICSPGNPTGEIIPQTTLEHLIGLAQRYNFVIAADECYSELYAEEQNPPPGLLQAAYAMGNTEFKNCIVFHSLSKRSSVPGLRSGFVAGDAQLIQQYLLYRTYHGCAMALPVQQASIAAWSDETHVIQNRAYYREKYAAVLEILQTVCPVYQPPGGFYLWLKTPIDDREFARRLFAAENVTVLPGSYLSRECAGINPGANHVRIALVASLEACTSAALRIKHFFTLLHH